MAPSRTGRKSLSGNLSYSPDTFKRNFDFAQRSEHLHKSFDGAPSYYIRYCCEMTCQGSFLDLYAIAGLEASDRRPEHVEVSAVLSVFDLLDDRPGDRRGIAAGIPENGHRIADIPESGEVPRLQAGEGVAGEQRELAHDPSLVSVMPDLAAHRRAEDVEALFQHFLDSLLLLPSPKPNYVPLTGLDHAKRSCC
ncbi:hypothetical protein ABIA20_005293 [Sinorhizobium fredii]